MRKKTVSGLIVIVAIVAVAIFAGCVEEEAPTPTPTPEIEQPTEYPMVNPNSYATGTPERALAEYLNCWKQEDWDRMVEFTQKTWRSGKEDPTEHLKDYYDFKHLVGAEITKKTVVSDTCADVEAKVYYCAFSATVATEKKITARVIRESKPHTPSSTGDWGVNPVSTLREG